MKKLALTSLLAVFAVSGANAANVINGDPLYRPAAGHFYSVTDLGSDTYGTNEAGLVSEFGYGITDRLAVSVAAGLSEENWFDGYDLEGMQLGASLRLLNDTNWKADVFGNYTVSGVWGKGELASFLNKNNTLYTWTAGARAGYTTGAWTVAGHVAYDYTNTESFNWDEKGADYELRAGVEALLALDSHWSLLAGAEYSVNLNNGSDNHGEWTGTFGANYNIDASHYVGAYIQKYMSHTNEAGEWKVEDGFGFGLTFGVDF